MINLVGLLLLGLGSIKRSVLEWVGLKPLIRIKYCEKTENARRHEMKCAHRYHLRHAQAESSGHERVYGLSCKGCPKGSLGTICQAEEECDKPCFVKELCD